MNRIVASILALFALLVGLFVASAPAARSPLVDAPGTSDAPRVAVAVPGPVVTELALRDADIAFYAKRAVEDPWSAADRAQLAGLWLQRGRESGDPADFRRAEQLARASLSLRESRNARTRLVLASSLLAQHRFTEALEVAEDLVRDEPEIVGYRALLAEIALELGRYEEAAAQFDTLYHARRDLAVAPRLARWAELRGDRAHARRILEAALETARSRSDLPREQLAWFHLRVADLALRHGRLRDAERALRDGLVGEPGDTRLVAALARVAAARGRWREAIRLVELAADRADLAALALAGDAAAALGDTATAERWYAAVEHRAAENPEPFNRQWTQFRVDHARRLPETIALLLDEVRVRPDVLGWDLLSWALYQGGAYSEARSAIRQAVRLGTQDALLYFHAGMIEHRLGRADSARALLEHALRLNPRFHHFYADTARAMLRATR